MNIKANEAQKTKNNAFGYMCRLLAVLRHVIPVSQTAKADYNTVLTSEAVSVDTC